MNDTYITFCSGNANKYRTTGFDVVLPWQQICWVKMENGCGGTFCERGVSAFIFWPCTWTHLWVLCSGCSSHRLLGLLGSAAKQIC